MFLITTANQKFWKKEGRILFLGEWCKLYKERDIWSMLDHETLPFIWKNRSRQAQSLGYINKLYERFLKVIAIHLNEIHQTEYGKRYWRIIIGPWLFYFLIFLYDRYLSIRSAIDSGKATNTWIIQKPDLPWVPKDYTTFNHWSIRHDDYNLYIYSQLIETLGGLPYETKNEALNMSQGQYDPPLRGVNYCLKAFMHKVNQIIPCQYKEIVFVHSYFHYIDLFRLQISLKQAPALFSPLPLIPAVSPDTSLREKLQLPASDSEFEKLAAMLIPEQIPTAYLESYKETHQKSLEYYPENPKLILTANDLFGSEGFKFWAAHYVSKGCKLAGIQHGGGYGSRLIDSNAYNEIRACDRYYTWGWSFKGSKKTQPLASGKLTGQEKIKPNPLGKILSLSTGEPRYSRWDHGDQMGSEMDQYCREQARFFHSLSPEVQSNFVFRLHPADVDWDTESRLYELAPNINIYRGKKNLREQLKQSRLCICTNNSTTLLETLSSNFPTLIFWNPKRCAIRKNAMPYYDALKKAGIYHETPESAALQANEIFDDPWRWWTSEKVQNAIQKFCGRFAITNSRWIHDWKRELLDICSKQ